MLKTTRMLLLCNNDSCVRLKDNTGGRNYLDVVLMVCFMVVTSHDVHDFCWQSRLRFSVFDIIWIISGACLWSSICLSCIFLGVVSLGLLWFSGEKLRLIWSVFICWFLFTFVRFPKYYGLGWCAKCLDLVDLLGAYFWDWIFWPLYLDRTSVLHGFWILTGVKSAGCVFSLCPLIVGW